MLYRLQSLEVVTINEFMIVIEISYFVYNPVHGGKIFMA